MKLLMRAFLCLSLALCSVVWVDSSSAQTAISTNNIIVNLNSFAGINPSAVRLVTVTPLYWAPVGSTVFVNPPLTITVAQQPSLTNGTVTISNQVCGVPYQIAFSGYTVWRTNYFIPANTNPAVTLTPNYFGRYIDSGNFWYSHPDFAVTNVTQINFDGTNGGAPLAAGENVTLTQSGVTNVVSVTNGTFDAYGDWKRSTNAALSALSQNDGSALILQQAVTNNIKGWGAYGDGVHDDTAAIQAAILNFTLNTNGYGGKITFPAGIYNITHLSFGNYYGLHLEGDAAGGTILQCTDYATNAVIAMTNVYQTIIENLNIYGNGQVQRSLLQQHVDPDNFPCTHGGIGRTLIKNVIFFGGQYSYLVDSGPTNASNNSENICENSSFFGAAISGPTFCGSQSYNNTLLNCNLSSPVANWDGISAGVGSYNVHGGSMTQSLAPAFRLYSSVESFNVQDMRLETIPMMAQSDGPGNAGYTASFAHLFIDSFNFTNNGDHTRLVYWRSPGTLKLDGVNVFANPGETNVVELDNFFSTAVGAVTLENNILQAPFSDPVVVDAGTWYVHKVNNLSANGDLVPVDTPWSNGDEYWTNGVKMFESQFFRGAWSYIPYPGFVANLATFYQTNGSLGLTIDNNGLPHGDASGLTNLQLYPFATNYTADARIWVLTTNTGAVSWWLATNNLPIGAGGGGTATNAVTSVAQTNAAVPSIQSSAPTVLWMPLYSLLTDLANGTNAVKSYASSVTNGFPWGTLYDAAGAGTAAATATGTTITNGYNAAITASAVVLTNSYNGAIALGGTSITNAITAGTNAVMVALANGTNATLAALAAGTNAVKAYTGTATNDTFIYVRSYAMGVSNAAVQASTNSAAATAIQLIAAATNALAPPSGTVTTNYPGGIFAGYGTFTNGITVYGPLNLAGGGAGVFIPTNLYVQSVTSTNGSTNLNLTANTIVYADAAKGLQSVGNIVGGSFTAGTLTIIPLGTTNSPGLTVSNLVITTTNATINATNVTHDGYHREKYNATTATNLALTVANSYDGFEFSLTFDTGATTNAILLIPTNLVPGGIRFCSPSNLFTLYAPWWGVTNNAPGGVVMSYMTNSGKAFINVKPY